MVRNRVVSMPTYEINRQRYTSDEWFEIYKLLDKYNQLDIENYWIFSKIIGSEEYCYKKYTWDRYVIKDSFEDLITAVSEYLERLYGV